MLAFWQTLAPALDSPTGSTFYALMALLLLSAASVLQPGGGPAASDRRDSLGLGVLMGLRLIELPVFVQAWRGQALAGQAMAPLERGVALASLVVVAWLWARPNGEGRGRQTLFALELLGALILTLAFFYFWLGVPAGSTFNYTDLDYAWGGAALIFLAIGFLQVLTSSSRSVLGLAHIAILFIGQAVHTFLAEPFGNMPLAVEAATLISLPLLFLLPRTPQAEAAPAPAEPETAEMEAGEAPMPAFFDELEGVAVADGLPAPERRKTGPLNAPEQLTRSLAEKLGADICVLATLNDAQRQLELQYGYNVLRTAPVEPARIALSDVPRLAGALQRDRSLRLEAEPGLTELAALSQALRLSFPGHLLATPFAYPQDLRRWVILILHIEHPWQINDEVVLEQEAETLGERLAAVLGVSDRKPAVQRIVEPVTEELEHTRSQLEALQQENARYRADVERLLAHIDEIQAAEGAPAIATAAAGSELVAALQQENQRLKQSLAALQAAPPQITAAPANVTAEQAKEELRLALEQVADLQTRLDAAQQAIVETSQQQPGAKIPTEQVELLASIAQELRQPLSSILGYTDLLLSESVGLLGALQRKFLERVRNSTERMNTLIDNLIRIAELDQSGYNLQRKPVDLGGVIDDALALLREQMQEKRIALRVNLPRQMPSLNTDRDALQQILYHLLQNADAATPADGAITLRAVFEKQAELGEYVLIQVSDSGGGIPEEDLPRVFSRIYRAQNPVIPGVGDSGVGLNIAETLTQALGGRIWVESQPGVGATFSVLLPLTSQVEPEAST